MDAKSNFMCDFRFSIPLNCIHTGERPYLCPSMGNYIHEKCNIYVVLWT